MKIKALLLGSAAAMVVATGAQAADAIVVEPEPVEYVRICDAYGSGFFYIPGTETCISFNGFVRSSYEKTHLDGNFELGNMTAGGVIGGALGGAGTMTGLVGTRADPSFTLWGQRARLNIDTRNETDWGTLRAQYRLEAGQSNVDVDVDMDRALISIAGFRFGFSDNYWTTNHGYGWVNAESVASVASGIIYPDGFYGFDDATLADYTWAADGLAITVGADDPRIDYGRDAFGNATNAGGTDGRANFYAGFNYSGDGWGIAGTAVHDSIAPELTPVGAVPGAMTVSDIGGWAYKVSANIDLSSMAPGASLWAMYMADGDYNTAYVHSNLLTENAESVWGVAYAMDLTDEVQFWANYYHIDGGNACAGGAAAGTSVPGGVVGVVGGGCVTGAAVVATGITEGDTNQWSVGLNWYPAAAPGFHVKASYTAGDTERSASYLVNGALQPVGSSFDYNNWEVTVRRDF